MLQIREQAVAAAAAAEIYVNHYKTKTGLYIKEVRTIVICFALNKFMFKLSPILKHYFFCFKIVNRINLI